MAGSTRKPRLKFWALKIELSPPAAEPPGAGAGENTGQGPGLRIAVGAGGFSRPGYVLSTRVSSFVRDQGLLAGINTVPFDPSSAREGEERRVVGVGAAGDRLIAPPVPRYDALVFYRDGGAAIVNQGDLLVRESAGAALVYQDSSAPGTAPAGREIAQASGGFHRILRDGELSPRALQRRDGPRYARSAAGLSAGGQALYLIAINGGIPGSRGATEAETALILKQLGAQDALNLDGGGSSALALRFAGGNVAVLNMPAHRGFPGWERAVALCLGVGLE
jgi:hypothetical protein